MTDTVDSRVRRGFAVEVPFHLVQSIRLLQALAETGYRIHVPREHMRKLAPLRDRFGATFQAGLAGVPVLPGIRVSHRQPLTAVGRHERPLVYPHAILRYCRSLWPGAREYRFSFAGMVTPSRRAILQKWVGQAGSDVPLTPTIPPIGRLLQRGSRLLGMSDERPRLQKRGDLVLWSSTRGRSFPTKSWDDAYHRLLASSEFVLCPAGDFGWTYRFFESIMCGAIPVVETTCDAYEGFRYRLFSEAPEDLAWNGDDAEFNAGRCVDRLTIPLPALADELGVLLGEVVVTAADGDGA